jgi:hypothetical protein
MTAAAGCKAQAVYQSHKIATFRHHTRSILVKIHEGKLVPGTASKMNKTLD